MLPVDIISPVTDRVVLFHAMLLPLAVPNLNCPSFPINAVLAPSALYAYIPDVFKIN